MSWELSGKMVGGERTGVATDRESGKCGRCGKSSGVSCWGEGNNRDRSRCGWRCDEEDGVPRVDWICTRMSLISLLPLG
jgi:hypothetical protein